MYIARRDFVKAGCAALLGGSFAPTLLRPAVAQDKQTAWKMRLSTSSIHYMGLPFEAACANIAKLGFEGIDIWSAHAGCPHLDDVAQRLGAAGLREVLQANRLQLFSFSVYQGGYAKYAEMLGEVGGGVAVRGSTGPCEPSELKSSMRKFLEGLKPLVELAEKHNSLLAIENHGHALLDSLDSFKAFVEMNQSPRLGIALAPYHLQTINASVVDAIETCGSQLFFFYAWQHASDTGQLPGIGPTDFKPWIAALAKVGYRGYVNPFMHGDLPPDQMDAALEKSREYVRRCWAVAP